MLEGKPAIAPQPGGACLSKQGVILYFPVNCEGASGLTVALALRW
jgi:hypothetical protein